MSTESKTRMTEGSIARRIILFAIPLFLGNLFQQLYNTADSLIGAFNGDPEVVHFGVMQARTIALFYFLLAFSHCIAAVLRGSGNASIPMIVMLCVWCLFRVSYITVGVHFIPDIRVVFRAYPLTWSISSGIFLYLFLRGKWVYGFEKRKNRILKSFR